MSDFQVLGAAGVVFLLRARVVEAELRRRPAARRRGLGGGVVDGDSHRTSSKGTEVPG